MVLHPAHYWTHINSEKIAKFIGKVEQFALDFDEFCRFVGINKPEIRLDNVSNPDVPADSGGSKYARLMSRRSLDRINELFRADFELFGYDIL